MNVSCGHDYNCQYPIIRSKKSKSRERKGKKSKRTASDAEEGAADAKPDDLEAMFADNNTQHQ